MKQFKPKYGLFETIRLYATWIRGNLTLFLLVIIAGILLIYLARIFSEASISGFLSTLFSNMIQLGIVTAFISRYRNEKRIDLMLIGRVFLIMIILTFYSYIIVMLTSLVSEQPQTRFLIQAFLFLGNVVCVNAIYHIFSSKTRLGFKPSLSWIADNIFYYVKLFLFYLLVLFIVVICISDAIEFFLEQKYANRFFTVFGLVVSSVVLPLSYFYIEGKRSEFAKYGI